METLQTALPRPLQAAILRIRGDHPFFGTLALFADMRISPSVETAATDGRTIWFNQDFVNRQEPASLQGLVVHELLHMALQHGIRRKRRDPLRWNIAADVVVNGMIRRDTDYSLPKGSVEMASLSDLSVEEVYEQLTAGQRPVPGLGLPDLLPEDWSMTPGMDPGSGGQESTDALGDTRARQLREHWHAALQQAGSVARRIDRGFGSHGTSQYRDCLSASEPTLSWRSLLWQHMVCTPFDFGGFDRRFIHRGLYVEDMTGDSVEVAICIDTSGSIGQPELEAFTGEIQGILDAYPQIRGTLFFADTRLYGPHPFGLDAPPAKPEGGGGTDFRPFFQWMSANQHRAGDTICIYLTDGHGTFPDRAPAQTVLWVVIDGGLASPEFPFGEVLRMGLPDEDRADLS